MTSDTASANRLRCWRCSASRICPYYIPGTGCAYAETANVALLRLRRFHQYRIAGTILAFVMLVVTVIPKAV